jgi:hypothetical protein
MPSNAVSIAETGSLLASDHWLADIVNAVLEFEFANRDGRQHALGHHRAVAETDGDGGQVRLDDERCAAHSGGLLGSGVRGSAQGPSA